MALADRASNHTSDSTSNPAADPASDHATDPAADPAADPASGHAYNHTSDSASSMPLDVLTHPLTILGVRVDPVTIAQAVTIIDAWIRVQGQARQVATVNTEFVMEAQRNPAFAAVLSASALAVADGAGILLAARLQGRHLTERVGGVELTTALLRHAAQQGYRVYLLGAAEGVAERAATHVRAAYPGLQIVGTYAGSPRPADEDAIVARINQAAAQILLVAYGAPAQELWIARNLSRLDIKVAIGVGGAFDYLAGVRPRAPLWMQRLWLEWLFRLITQPWRWRRMLAIPRFMVAVMLHNRHRVGNKKA